jgi:hypothetical protein
MGFWDKTPVGMIETDVYPENEGSRFLPNY